MKQKNKRRAPRQRPDTLPGRACTRCGSAATLRRIEHFPTPIQDCRVDFHLYFCIYCGWNKGSLTAHSDRELSQAELDQIQAALQNRLEAELAGYMAYQEKLASLPLGLAHTVVGAALGFDEAEMSMVQQVARGVSPELAYGEICRQLAEFPLAPAFFQGLTDTPAGQVALVESLGRWRNVGFPPPWGELVKAFLRE